MQWPHIVNSHGISPKQDIESGQYLPFRNIRHAAELHGNTLSNNDSPEGCTQILYALGYFFRSAFLCKGDVSWHGRCLRGFVASTRLKTGAKVRYLSSIMCMQWLDGSG